MRSLHNFSPASTMPSAHCAGGGGAKSQREFTNRRIALRHVPICRFRCPETASGMLHAFMNAEAARTTRLVILPEAIIA
jgi:hypothetical protein